jgi:hypothetical protein
VGITGIKGNEDMYGYIYIYICIFHGSTDIVGLGALIVEV